MKEQLHSSFFVKKTLLEITTNSSFFRDCIILFKEVTRVILLIFKIGFILIKSCLIFLDIKKKFLLRKKYMRIG